MANKRNTTQKNVIFCELTAADHPTATELYERIHPKYPTISRATVFRVLGEFASSGKVRELEFIGSDTRFDARVNPHAHCFCLKCKKVTDVFDERFAPVLSQTSVGGYKIALTELEFCGLCPACAAGNDG